MSYATYEWFLKENFTDYTNKWVAIIDNKVVGSSQDISELISVVKKEYPHKVPFITKIRDKLSIL